MPDEAKDHWEGNDAVYVHYGKRYTTVIVDGNVGIACLGEVQKAVVTPPNGSNRVTKVSASADGLTNTIQEQGEGTYVTMGRPKKEGDNVSRMTKWRRKREVQGILL